MNRKPGFYWVKLKSGEWVIASYSPFKHWYLSGIESAFDDNEFNSILEKEITVPTDDVLEIFSRLITTPIQ